MKTDDPRLTAYALDELPATERAEIEALLREDAALAAELEATRAFAAQLRSELKVEEGAPLSAHQRSEVLALANAQAVSGNVVAMRVRPQRLMKIAAALLIVGMVAALFFPAIGLQKENSRKFSAGRHNEGRSERLVEQQLPFADAAGKDVFASADEHALNPAAPMPVLAPELAEVNKDGVVAGRQSKAVADVSAAQSASPSEPSHNFVMDVARSGTGSLVLGEKVELGTPHATGGKVELGVSLSDKERMTVTRATPASVTAAPESRVASSIQPPKLVTAQTTGGAAIRRGPEPALPEPVARSESEIAAGARLALVEKQKAQSLYILDPTGAPDDFGTDRYVRLRPERGNTEAYDAVTDNAFLPVKDNPLSTFSIDVDTASYANVRRFLTSGTLPPKGAVRIEEMVNYFPYDYPQPAGDAPFSATMEVAACPWTPAHRLVRIGLKGKDVARSERPAANLVFLIDVSGSMQPANKLPLVKESLRLLIDQLDDRDLVAIAVYAGASGTVLEPTRDKSAMRAALDRLQAGGSTNGAGGIQLAYELTAKSFIKGGTNRVILATDGDFNVGVTNQSDLVDLITQKAKSGIFLSVLGYGMGNLKDSTLEKLADKGNGNYGYIDTLAEAKKTLVEQMNGTLVTIAKDVKIQVEFNPAQAAAYRLIGYENRVMAKEDFNDDKKDAGEIGAGHTVTALYEVVPAGGAVPGVAPAVDELKYSAKPARTAAPSSEVPATGEPGDIFVNAYTLTQQAEKGEAEGELQKALGQMRLANEMLGKIAASHPDWQPQVVAFRQKRVAEAITRIEETLKSGGAATGKTAEAKGDKQTANLELLTLKLRYKKPDGDVSTKLEFPLTDRGETWEKSSTDFRWAAAVASFGMMLRESPHKGTATWDSTLELAREGRGDDRAGYRAECLALIEKARTIAR
jgi:Ca-activated chloride channel family protein